MFDIKFKSYYSSSKGNLFELSGYKTKILIECGISIQKIREATNFSLSSYDGCIVSHCHMDHAKAVYDVAVSGVEVYSNQSVFDKFQPHHRFNVINKTFDIGEFKITPFDVDHDVTNYGYMIDSTLSGERLVFIIDTFYSPVTFKGVTHFVIEANHSEDTLRKNIEKNDNNMHLKRLWKSHMSIERTCSILKANDLSMVKEIHLTHLSSANGNGIEFKKNVEQLTIGKVFVC